MADRFVQKEEDQAFLSEDEFDLHVWRKAETEDSAALYTISRGKRPRGAGPGWRPRPICIDMTLDGALEFLRRELTDGEED